MANHLGTIQAGVRGVLFWAIIGALFVAPLAPAIADEKVLMRRDNFGQDLAFIDSFLKRSWPHYYKRNEPLDWPELTLDRVSVGRYDVNGDGQSELFMNVGYGPLCGTVGCPTHVFAKRDGEWVEVDHVSGMMGDSSMDVWVDPLTGHRTVFSYYAGFRWTGEAYEYLGDDEVVEVSALVPPDLEGEGGCVGPQDQGFGYLIEYVGTGRPMCLIYDPNVKLALDTLLGDEFLHLRKNLDRRPRIDYSEGHVYVEGSRRPTLRDWEERAMVMVSTYDGRAHVGIYSEGTRIIYSRAKQWSHLPRLLRVWARGHLDPYAFDEPQDIVWIGRGEEE